MRHRKFSQRLSRPLGARRATLRNLAINLLKYQKIKTTKAKAKATQSWLEPLISLGRKNTLQSRRQALKMLNDRAAVRELFSRIAPLFKDKGSGFSRIIRYARRRGDGAELVYLELTEKIAKVKPAKSAKAKKEKAEEAKPEVKPQAQAKPKAPREKPRAAKELKPKKFLGGLRRLFKKERDAL